jgi:hypothetical protein
MLIPTCPASVLKDYGTDPGDQKSSEEIPSSTSNKEQQILEAESSGESNDDSDDSNISEVNDEADINAAEEKRIQELKDIQEWARINGFSVAIDPSSFSRSEPQTQKKKDSKTYSKSVEKTKPPGPELTQKDLSKTTQKDGKNKVSFINFL